jgi:electron transfer flavoprotein beta subunit
MKIAVLLKQVVSRESKPQLSSDHNWIDETTLDFELNESDGYALEEALQIKDQSAELTEVIAISMGPSRIEKILRDALAKGADRAIQIQYDDMVCLADPSVVASTLSAVLKPEACDLILAGLQSEDLGAGQTGIMLGELLGLSTASLVTEIEVKDSSVLVSQELESGWFQYVLMPLPASLAIHTGAKQPRYPTIKGIMSAKKKQITLLQIDDLPKTPPLLQLRRLNIPHKHNHSQMIEGSPEQTVTKLVEIMKTETNIM